MPIDQLHRDKIPIILSAKENWKWLISVYFALLPLLTYAFDIIANIDFLIL